jgi:hypothetical protein
MDSKTVGNQLVFVKIKKSVQNGFYIENQLVTIKKINF